MAVIRGAETIQSAKDLYNFGKTKCEQPSETANCKQRHFRYIEAVSRETKIRFKPIPQNRKIHQIITTGNPSLLFIRNLSCYSCDECIEGNYGSCVNQHVGKTTTANISRENVNDAEVDVDDTEEEPHGLLDLCQPGSILAVYTDDPNEDFYLFRAESPPEKLKRKTKDSWGATFEKGHEIIRGVYFEATNVDFRYRLLNDRHAVVPSCSVRHILMNASMTNKTLVISKTDNEEILASMPEVFRN
ncbi:uncharacterized protein LOC117336823 [Pecten maximus]|uniref:uncharacterized protein LOC117336823 n=1 Tax=Pecten maximus TaxID=6579 RepID=UPI001458A724|nr:uncharacterized protein LOC117336823 [Pecten maximus]